MKEWITDLVRELNPTKLSRERFVAKYFPQYVKEWRPDYRIHLRPDGRPTRMPTRGDFKAQTTKRSNIIDREYNQYLAILESQPK